MSPERVRARRVETPGLVEPASATWSNCLVVGREVIMSGVTARGAQATGAGEQAREIFARMERMLEAAGGGLRNIHKLVIYVTDIAFKDAVNAARATAFRRLYPASTLVAVNGFAFPDLLVEIDAFANLDVDMWAETP